MLAGALLIKKPHLTMNRRYFAGALELERSDEVGEIARSLERMRLSMHAVGTRNAARPKAD